MTFSLTVAVVCSSDEGVYVDTYGKITKNVVLQWGEEPTSVGELSHSLLGIVLLYSPFTMG